MRPGPHVLEDAVRPPSPIRLPARDGSDGVLRVRSGVVTRLLHIEGQPVVVRAWQLSDKRIALRAEGVDPGDVSAAGPVRGSVLAPHLRLRSEDGLPRPPAEETLEQALRRMRFALWLDDDLMPFYRRFKSDSLLGPLIRRRPWGRPDRRPWAWEALAWAVTKQLIESGRANEIQRRLVRRHGARLGPKGRDGLYDVPGSERIASLAPAELVAADLAEKRALALRRIAAEVARGRIDPADPSSDQRLLATPEIGPWTVQVLALTGRGEEDSLPAGDLGYIKLVGHLAGLGRRATIEEVEDFFAPYEPYRGLAANFVLMGLHKTMARRPPLRYAAA